MADLNFMKFISDNVDLAAEKKVALLEDFCAQYGWTEFLIDNDGNEVPNPVSRTDFANQKVTQFFIQSINAARRKRAEEAVTIEELVMEEA